MIELRPYRPEDGVELAGILHDVSLAELAAAGLPLAALPAYLDREDICGNATSGFIDGGLAFVGCTMIYYEEGTRVSSFFLARGFDRQIALGMRKWSRAEAARCPAALRALVYSYSTHPLLPRLFAALSLKPIGREGGAAVYEWLKPSLALRQEVR